jgi:hypothetical protein
MPVTAGPIYPGIKDGLVFAIDPANKDSWAGPTSDTVNNLPTYNSSISGSIKNDTSGSYGSDESFSFDGIDDRIELNDDSSIDIFGGDFSISLWFSRPSLPANGSARAIVEIGGFSNKTAMTLGFTSNTGVGFAVGSNWYTNAGSGYNDGNFHHMVGTRTGTTYKIYIDGEEVEADAPSGGYSYTSVNTIGKGNFNGNFQGNIGPILFYNRVLEDYEITQNYNRLKGRFGLS